MALVAPPGAENPSPAFLAGQAHGAALAVQHHIAGAKPAVIRAPKPAAPVAGGNPTLNDLLAQAQGIAQQETNQQVNAITAQQNLYDTQGQQKAQEIQQASQAAAQLIASLGLPAQTASSYNTAAQNIAGMAQGFSGQTQTDASNAAAQVQAQLAGLGAPAGSAKTATGQMSDPAALGNVLYGLGGFIPGNVLETTGQAQAGAQRTLPLSALSYGQQQAAGVLGAAQQNADALTPNIVNARSNEPSLYQSILSSLNSTLTNQALAQSLIGSRSNSSQIQGYNATTGRIKATNTNTLANAKLNAPDPSLSKVYGHVVDAHGNAILVNGKTVPVVGGSKTAAAKPLTASQRVHYTGLANAHAAADFAAGSSLAQAIQNAREAGYLSDPRVATITMKAINKAYPGTPTDLIDAMARNKTPLIGGLLSPKAKALLDKVLPLPFGG